MSWAPDHLDDGDWFHGSPEVFEILATGSAITRSRAIAEAFSHRPTLVSVGVEDDARPVKVTVTHNGALDGYLYVVDEPITEADIYPHPASSMPGIEWLTRRPLKVRLIKKLPVKK